MIDFLLRQLASFTGPDWEQEDDMTLVTLQRLEGHQAQVRAVPRERGAQEVESERTWLALANLTVPSEPGAAISLN